LFKRKPSPRFNPKKHIEKPRRKYTLNANSSHARALGGPEVVSSIGVEHNGCYRGQTCQGQDFESHQGEDQLQWESGVLENCCSGSDARGGSPRKGTPEDVSYGSNSTIYINKCINEQKIKIRVFMPPANWMNLRLYRLLNMPILSQE
jgi:hypothetical protein